MSSMKNGRRVSINWIFYILMGLGLIALLIWSTRGEIAHNPSRGTVANLGPYGLITVQLQTNPYPAKPTGTVGLSFMVIDSQRRVIQPDIFSFEYGYEGSDRAVSSGTAQPMSDGSGMLMAGAQFSSVGTWWLRVTVVKGGYQDEVRFTIEVRPAQ